jgi:hypothetical protein
MEATANAFDMRRIPHTFATLQPEQQAISSFGSMPHQPFTLLLGQYRQQLELIRCHEQANSQQLLLQQRLRQHHSSSSTAMTNHSPITRPRWSDHATYAGNSHIATQSNDSSGPDVYRARANNREQILFPTMLTPATEAHQQDHLDRTLALLLRGSDSTTLAASAAGGAALASSIAGGISHSRNGSAPTLAESTFTTSLMRHIPATADTSSNLALRRSACTPLLHAHELSSQSLHRSPTDISTRIATPAETRVPPTHATVRATASLPQSQDDDNGDVYDDSKPSARKRARAARLSTEQSDFAA